MLNAATSKVWHLSKTARWVTAWRSPSFLAAATAGNVQGIVRPFVRWAICKLIRFRLTWARQLLVQHLLIYCAHSLADCSTCIGVASNITGSDVLGILVLWTLKAQAQPGFTMPGGFAEFVSIPRADRNVSLMPPKAGAWIQSPAQQLGKQ